MVKRKVPSVEDIKKYVDIAKIVVDDALPLVRDKVVPAVKDIVAPAAEIVAQKAKDAKEVVGEQLQEHADEAEAKKLETECNEAAEKARKGLIVASMSQMGAKQFKKAFEENIPEDGDLISGCFALSGCYAIATYKSAREKDLSRYQDIFVSGSTNIGFDIYRHLRGLGNPDVYADFKFKEPMKVLIFPCNKEQLSEKISSYIDILQSAESYNKWDNL